MEPHNSWIQTLWLIMCVFLFYQQSIDMVSGLNKAKKKKVNIADPFNTKCSEFEEFDGFECVCTSVASDRCKTIGGMVCDNTGAVYSTPCLFAVNMCQKKIPLDRKIMSCGACEKLKLTGGKSYLEGEVHAIFIRQGSDMELKTKYQSTDGNGLQVFYSSELSAWAIGRITSNKIYVSLVQETNSTYPQDNAWGMFVAKKKYNLVSWEADSTLRLECMQDGTMIGTRKKRLFLLVTFVVASILVSAAVASLKIAQSSRGCLYYPSVCDLRTNIKTLQPRVKRLQDKFLLQYGNPEDISEVVDVIHDQVLDIRGKIITIKELHTELNGLLSNVIQDHGSFADDVPELKSLLKEHREWVNSTMTTVMNKDIVYLVTESVIAGVTIAAMETATTFATAVAGIGLVLAIGFGIVSVISSIKEERSVRDKLQEAHSNLLKAKKDINIAFKNMDTFQKQFCKVIISFLRNLSFKGKNYGRHFFTLHGFILATYGESKDDCKYLSIYSKTNLITLNMLHTYYVRPLHKFLSKDIVKIKKKIIELVETRAFFRELNKRIVAKKLSPRKLYGFLKSHKPKMAKKMFVSLYDLLKYISSVIPKTTCYWGTNLDLIRNNEITKINYLQYPICDCPEIERFTTQLKIGVKTHTAPCKLAKQVQSSVFNCNYKVIKFIADVILSNENCYWGYDLKSLRNQHIPLEINNAIIDSHLLLSFQFFKHSQVNTDQVKMTRTLMCSKHKICSREWQTFLLCHVMKIPNFNTVCLKSNMLTAGPHCIPDNKRFQSCDM